MLAGRGVWVMKTPASGVEYALMNLRNNFSGALQGGRAVCTVVATGLALAGCAQQQQHLIRTTAYHGHEHFSSSKYGPASARVIEDGQPVPHGGGQYLVGRPYTIAGHTYYPTENEGYSAVGMASWYGDAFHGRRTANGEVYDKNALSAAHPTMPLPSYARVTNLSNGYSVIVRVNDRGPYHGGRVMDVSSRVADVLDFKGAGTAKIKVEYVGRAPMEGSDDNQLLSSLRTDGGAASIDGASAAPTMVAEATAPAPSYFPPSVEPTAPPPAPQQHVREIAPEPERMAVAQDQPERRESAPLPPVRPYDLGASKRAAGDPPRPPVRLSQIDRALYFADERTRVNDPLSRLLTRVNTRALADK